MTLEETHSQDGDDAEQLTLNGDLAEISYEAASSTKGQKVRQIARKYEMNDLGDELERKYTALGNRKSLRELEETVNLKILDHSTRGAKVSESEYRDCVHRLKSDELELTEERLNALGVDGSEIIGDMVSYETIRSYLRNTRGVTADLQYNTPAKSAETVARVEARLRQILESMLKSHHGRGELPAEPDIETNFQVICPDCETPVSAVKYLKLQTCPSCL